MTNKRQHIESAGREKVCPSCSTRFLCLHNESCWCMDYALTAEQLAYLRNNYDDCLCPACLAQHGEPVNDPQSGHSRN